MGGLFPRFSIFSIYKLFFSVILITTMSLIYIYSLRLPVIDKIVVLDFNNSTDAPMYHNIMPNIDAVSFSKGGLDVNLTLDTITSRMKAMALSKGGIDANKTLSDSYIRHEQQLEKAIIDGVKNVRNVPPFPYIMRYYGQTFLNNSSCAPFPDLFEIRFINTIWQSQTATKWALQILGAYWDNRELNEGGPSVRILGIVDREVKNPTAFCQIWFEHEKAPKIFPVVDYDFAWQYDVPKHRQYNGIYPYIWNCPVHIAENGTLPISVSVVENICDAATTNVKIHYDNPLKKEKVAVCVRPMNFPVTDISIRLVEWLEIVKLFGAHKVFLYEQNVHPNITKVYDYYMQSGFVDVAKITFPAGLPSEASLAKVIDLEGGYYAWMTEILPINDCLYRNMYKYEYLAVIDIDEIFVPNQSESWQELIENLENKYGHNKISSFAFRSTIYHAGVSLESDAKLFFGIPPYLNMIQEVYRGCEARPRGEGTKCFHNPSKVKILHNHLPFECLGRCNDVDVNIHYSDAHHHRFGMLQEKFCENNTFVIDTTLWKWKDKIVKNTNFVLRKLNLV